MKQRLIDANALVTDISFFDGDKYHYGYSQGMIESAPTVDAVQVVRCKECIHRDPEDHRCDCGGHEWLKGRVLPMPDDWFCADGERRTE